MALVIKDRVKQTTTTTGTGTLTLNGTVDGFQTFAAALSDGDTTYYSILEPSTNNWEVGLGTWTEGSSLLARTTVLASSNSGSAVNLTAQAEVFISQPAGKAAFFNANGDLELNQDPTSALHAATKEYVDTIAAAGLHYHDPVRVEQEGNLSATYDNGTAGVGATLTNNSTQAALVIDGVTLSTADRVLVYEQTDATQNGVYTVTNTGSASTNWVLTRSTDTDSYAPSDPNSFGKGDAFFVLEGNEGAGELYVMNTEGTITFGTTNITFTQVASTAVYSAGNGLTLTGTVFAADAGTGVTVDGTGINIGQAVETTSDVTFNSVTASLSGNVTGNVTGDVTGNADTATALETARNIGGVSFDGTASINLPGVNTTGNQDTTGNAATATAWATGRTISLTGDVTGSVTGVDGSGNATIATTIAANSVALGTDTTGDYVSTITSGNYLTGGVTGEGSTPTLNVDATPTNTASKVVARDASGNFSAGTITANLTGTASNAATLDSLDSTQFLRSDADDSMSGQLLINNSSANPLELQRNSQVGIEFNDTSTGSRYLGVTSGNLRYGSNLDHSTNSLVWTSGNDGSGSGLDADTVDGIQASSFLRSDAADTFSGKLTYTGSNDGLEVGGIRGTGLGSQSGDYIHMYERVHIGSPSGWGSGNAPSFGLSTHGGAEFNIGSVSGAPFTFGGNTVWHAGNDGSGSGLDADTVDGSHASAFALKTGATFTGKVIVDQEVEIRNGDGSDTHFNYADGSNNYIRGGITTIDTGVDLNQNDIYDVRYLTATYLRAGDGNDGYFYSDSNGRTAFTGGEFYITAGVPYYYNYATNQYHGGSSGDNHYFRGNTLSGNSWSLTGAGAASFASVNINGNLNAVDNIYLASTMYHEGDTNTYVSFGTDVVNIATGGTSRVYVSNTGVQLGDTGNGYFQPVSGNYGSIQIDGGAHGGWEGYSIGGRAVFMHNNSTTTGIYNDVNNHWLFAADNGGAANLYYNGSNKIQTTSTGANINGDLNAVDNIYLASSLIHEGDTDTYVGFANNAINLYTGGSLTQVTASGVFISDGSLREDYDALSGTTPTCDVSSAGAFSLTMTGNTTFTFSNAVNNYSNGFVLQLTGNGSTVTWPTSVDWAGGTAPDAPASGETDIYVFWTRDGGTTWYGVLSVDAAA
jgi:hypothetical protein